MKERCPWCDKPIGKPVPHAGAFCSSRCSQLAYDWALKGHVAILTVTEDHKRILNMDKDTYGAQPQESRDEIIRHELHNNKED